MKPLPRDTVGDLANCPWCGGSTAEAAVRLADLADAYVAEGLERPWRGELGQPDPSGLVVSCPTCERPSLVALRDGMVRLLAVRTKADVEFLGGSWGRPL